jgi:hypothetical protein
MHTSDKFHDECGVMAIYAHPEAEKLAYLGLHALQHRGQESAGIVTSNGLALRAHRAMGLVADIFTEEVLSQVHRWPLGTPVTPPRVIPRYSMRSPSWCNRTRA